MRNAFGFCFTEKNTDLKEPSQRSKPVYSTEMNYRTGEEKPIEIKAKLIIYLKWIYTCIKKERT